MSLPETISSEKIPQHIAIIMDGNGRWAKKQGEVRVFGHQNAVSSVREATEACVELGVKYLTLYAFSTENWSRPKEEVNALMELLVATIKAEVPELNKNGIRLNAIGDTEALPPSCKSQLREAIDATRKNTALTLTLALSYSGRWDLTKAMKLMALDVRDGLLNPIDIREETIKSYLSTRDLPDPELMIRTSGEFRISNFLLWELAYAEFFITETLWPDFRKSNLFEAVADYQKRERRFGKTSEQLNTI